MDHLEGKLFIERLSPLKRGMIRKKMHKRAQEGNKLEGNKSGENTPG
jgi:hypothetical protein